MSDGRQDTTRLPGARFAPMPLVLTAVVAALAAAGGGCEGPAAEHPSGTDPGVAVHASAARLGGGTCRPNYVLTREPDGLAAGGCARSLPATGGTWEGRPVARRGPELFCQYRWRPARLNPFLGARERILDDVPFALAPAPQLAAASPAAVAVAAPAGALAAAGVAVGAGAGAGAVDQGQVVVGTGGRGGGILDVVRPAVLSVDPPGLQYGAVILGQPFPGPRTVFVRNLGSVDTGGPVTVAIQGQNPDQFVVTGNGCPTGPLAGNASCEVQVRYFPTAGGNHAAVLVLDTPATPAVSVSLWGAATLPPELAVTPPAAGFGTILPFGAGQDRTFTIANKGPIGSGGLTVAIVGGAALDFVKVADTCQGASLAPGQTCTATIRYVPHGAGGHGAALQVSSPFGTSTVAELGGRGWPGLVGREPDLTPFLRATPVIDWAVDCPNLVPLAPVAQPSTAAAPGWKSLQRVFHSRVGHAPATGPATRPVRVAVIDSAARPYVGAERDRLPHGRAVGRAIGDLACADPFSVECNALVRNYLAMPMVDLLDGAEDLVNGGYYGNTGHLARALTAALDDWAMAPAGTQLVINISLGWEPSLSNPVADAAVRAVLSRAACQGALVIAAAGNGAGGVGEMNPAAWHGQTAECGGGRKLLYSASGLDARDQPLALSRRKSGSLVRAYAEAIVTAELPAREPRGHTEILTGTSMAAAAISGVAAAVWQRHPDPVVDAAAVMDLLEKSGDMINERPTTCPGQTTMAPPPPCLSRRVSLCQATRKMPGAGACPAAPLEGPANVPAMSTAGLPTLIAQPCTGPRCPSQATIDPQTVPQPGSPSCTLGRCVYDDGTGNLVVQLPSEVVDLGTTVMRVRTDTGVALDVTNPDSAGLQALPPAFQVSLAAAEGAKAITLQFGTMIPNAGFKPSSQEEAALIASQSTDLTTANR